MIDQFALYFARDARGLTDGFDGKLHIGMTGIQRHMESLQVDMEEGTSVNWNADHTESWRGMHVKLRTD
ncbi:MAG: hypothetical protein AMXMBFR82_36010 [Candidatus Hydrogenedentota bacterium]